MFARVKLPHGTDGCPGPCLLPPADERRVTTLLAVTERGGGWALPDTLAWQVARCLRWDGRPVVVAGHADQVGRYVRDLPPSRAPKRVRRLPPRFPDPPFADRTPPEQLAPPRALDGPWGLHVAPSGALYACDRGHQRVVMWPHWADAVGVGGFGLRGTQSHSGAGPVWGVRFGPPMNSISEHILTRE